ncbi:MAG: hypothetical protein HRT67_08970 [Flavobacteriaceae bacterium]|nr:hypothetical protein [Flavobacteriaceae bacterium]
MASANEEGFVRNENLLQQPSQDPAVIIDTIYTKPITIITPAIGEHTIAAFSQLIYEGKQITATDAGNTTQQYILKDIDDLFGLIEAKSVFAFDEGYTTS